MGYCLTTMEVALTLMSEEDDLINMNADKPDNDSDMFEISLREHRKSQMRNSILRQQQRTQSLNFTENILATEYCDLE